MAGLERLGFGIDQLLEGNQQIGLTPDLTRPGRFMRLPQVRQENFLGVEATFLSRALCRSIFSTVSASIG
jgi:hypothetical protein